MVAIIRNADATIKTYAERGEDFDLQPGERLEDLPESFAQYSARLRISAGGLSGRTILLPAGATALEVQVACPGQTEVMLEVNNVERPVNLENGLGCFTLRVAAGGVYVIRPRDRQLYCAAGEALLAVMVELNGAG